jgi:GDP-4-dehydro-6-deoxy-D-mannose reductase
MDPAALLAFVREVQPEWVFHLAGMSSPIDSLSSPRPVYETNFLGAFNLLESVQRVAPRARTLLVGSVQCYGSPNAADLPLTEKHPFAPRTPYATSKAAADLLGFQFFITHGLPVIRVRAANHTGPGQSAAFVCSDFARQLAAIELGAGPAELHVGNIDVGRDFCDVRDVARAYVMLAQKGMPSEAYNVGSGRAVTLKTILDILISFSSRRIQVTQDPQRTRANDVKEEYANIDKLVSHTGWSPEYDLTTTLRDLYEYWIAALKSEPAADRATPTLP